MGTKYHDLCFQERKLFLVQGALLGRFRGLLFANSQMHQHNNIVRYKL